jgi:hypothetical protein
MASGHVNRTQRPDNGCTDQNCNREETPCQLGAVHTWHLADIRNLRGISQASSDATNMSKYVLSNGLRSRSQNFPPNC